MLLDPRFDPLPLQTRTAWAPASSRIASNAGSALNITTYRRFAFASAHGAALGPSAAVARGYPGVRPDGDWVVRQRRVHRQGCCGPAVGRPGGRCLGAGDGHRRRGPSSSNFSPCWRPAALRSRGRCSGSLGGLASSLRTTAPVCHS
jgi:hypothetical protein